MAAIDHPEVLPPLVGDEGGIPPAPGRGRRFWERTVDVLVVGGGGAGTCAALEAAAAGAEVLVVDRFGGGGATALSGGVVYAGGGTDLQRRAGHDDDPASMAAYLQHEAGDVVDEATLRAFCDSSVETLRWLQRHGVPMPARGQALKTSYPPDDCTLYFSGNELCEPYRQAAPPAPRGHRADGRGLTGGVLFGALAAAARRAGVRRWTRAQVRRLVVDADGAVIGAEVAVLPRVLPLRWLHEQTARAVRTWGAMQPRLAAGLLAAIRQLEQRAAQLRYVRVRGGVVLAAGGFVYHRPWLRRHAPAYADGSLALGTAGDTGAGIALGQSVGGVVGQMDRCCAWRFIDPPTALVSGLLVGPDGRRVGNEQWYGATLGDRIALEHGGRALLILDAAQRERVRQQLRSQTMGWFQRLTGWANITVNARRAPTLAALAAKVGLPTEALAAAVAAYNAGVAAGADAAGKELAKTAPIAAAPFYAVRCDLDSFWFPTPTMTLGGLRVDGTSQRVCDAAGRPVAGLFAAGRSAVGVSSNRYVSGLSLADCIFSGRNAGRAAAAAAGTAAHARRTAGAAPTAA